MPRKKAEKPPRDRREDEWFRLSECMECGRKIPNDLKNYTVKSSIGFGTAVVCPICASKPGIRLKTPYISYDGLKVIRELEAIRARRMGGA